MEDKTWLWGNWGSRGHRCLRHDQGADLGTATQHQACAASGTVPPSCSLRAPGKGPRGNSFRGPPPASSTPRPTCPTAGPGSATAHLSYPQVPQLEEPRQTPQGRWGHRERRGEGLTIPHSQKAGPGAWGAGMCAGGGATADSGPAPSMGVEGGHSSACSLAAPWNLPECWGWGDA